MANQRNKKNIYWAAFGVCVIIAIVAFFLVFILSEGKEIRYTSEDPSTETAALVCEGTSATKNNFFEDSGAMNYSNKIKVLLKEGRLDKINYTFSGTYPSEDAAKEASSSLHAKYNIYMSETNIDQEEFYPTFTVDGSNLLINFSITGKNFNSKTAKLVFIDEEQFKKLKDFSADEMKNIYKESGFNCQSTK